MAPKPLHPTPQTKTNSLAAAEKFIDPIKAEVKKGNEKEEQACEQEKQAEPFHAKAAELRKEKDQHYIAAGEKLIEVRGILNSNQFKEYCRNLGPGFGTSRVKDLIAMANKNLTPEAKLAKAAAHRAKQAGRKAKHDAKKKEAKKAGVTTANSNGQSGNDTDPEASAAAMKAHAGNSKSAGKPKPAPTKSEHALAEWRVAVQNLSTAIKHWLPQMTDEDRKIAVDLARDVWGPLLAPDAALPDPTQ